jgi:hypothetical protein
LKIEKRFLYLFYYFYFNFVFCRSESSDKSSRVLGHPLSELFFSICDKLPLGALLTLHYVPSIKRTQGNTGEMTFYESIMTANTNPKKG